jgi:hypothetical protein
MVRGTVVGTTLMAVDVKLDGASFEAGAPRPLFKVSLPPQPRNTRYPSPGMASDFS